MRKANRKPNGVIDQRLAETPMSAHQRQQAVHTLRTAEAIVDAMVWAKNKIASFGSLLLRPGFKH